MKNLGTTFTDVEYNHDNLTPIENALAIKSVGFDKVFISWRNHHWTQMQQDQFDACKELGLDVEFAHLPYVDEDGGIAKLWFEGEAGEEYKKMLISDIEKVSQQDCKTVVLHTTRTMIDCPLSQIGLKRWQEIVDFAESVGVDVAIENINIMENNNFLFENIKNKNLKLCYDCGHDLCYFGGDLDLTPFKGRIGALHIHDNDLQEDLHLVVGDGRGDFDKVISKLKKIGCTLPLMSEARCVYKYKTVNTVDFYRHSYSRLLALDEKYRSKD